MFLFHIVVFNVEKTKENAKLVIPEQLELWIFFVPSRRRGGQISKCSSIKFFCISEKAKYHLCFEQFLFRYSCGESAKNWYYHRILSFGEKQKHFYVEKCLCHFPTFLCLIVRRRGLNSTFQLVLVPLLL